MIIMNQAKKKQSFNYLFVFIVLNYNRIINAKTAAPKLKAIATSPRYDATPKLIPTPFVAKEIPTATPIRPIINVMVGRILAERTTPGGVLSPCINQNIKSRAARAERIQAIVTNALATIILPHSEPTRRSQSKLMHMSMPELFPQVFHKPIDALLSESLAVPLQTCMKNNYRRKFLVQIQDFSNFEESFKIQLYEMRNVKIIIFKISRMISVFYRHKYIISFVHLKNNFFPEKISHLLVKLIPLNTIRIDRILITFLNDLLIQ